MTGQHRPLASVRMLAVSAAIAVAAVLAGGHFAPPRAQAPDAPPRDIAGAQLWTCGMHPQVLQDKPGTCPICGMALTPLTTRPQNTETGAGAEREVRYWWDPTMSPPYIAEAPGTSPAGTALRPVYADEVAAGTPIVIDPVVVQNMGLRVATVAVGPLRATVRAVGYLEEPAPNQIDINLRVSGWIEKLHASVEGMHVRQGDALFELYSPELQVAIEELIAARRMRAGSSGDSAATADTLVATAKQKLQLLGLTPAQVDRMAALDRAPATVPFLSPMTGHVMEKPVVAGAAVQAGDRVLRLSDRSTMWLDVRIYEQDFPFVYEGQTVTATVAAVPGRRFEGRIAFVHPHVDPATRTALVRVILPNRDGVLRQGMYASTDLHAELTPRAVLVPRQAVIDTGTRQIAFVVRDRGRFEPRTVTVGSAADDGRVQIVTGLAPGERVVTSGQFLLDAESRLREAIQKHLDTQRLSAEAASHGQHAH